MDFIQRHGNEEEFIASHEQFRGPVLFHRTQAATILALERRRYEEAIDALREGVDRLNAHQRTWWEQHDPDESPNPALIDHLRNFEQEIRKNFRVEKTLREQLDEAVAREDYEQAARLRDQIKAQAKAGVTVAVVSRQRSAPQRTSRIVKPPPTDAHDPPRPRIPPGRPGPRRRRASGRSSRRPGGSGRRN